MDALEAMNLALKVLNRGRTVSRSEIETLRSFLGGDAAHLGVEEIAEKVIQRELNRRKAKRFKSEPARDYG